VLLGCGQAGYFSRTCQADSKARTNRTCAQGEPENRKESFPVIAQVLSREAPKLSAYCDLVIFCNFGFRREVDVELARLTKDAEKGLRTAIEKKTKKAIYKHKKRELKLNPLVLLVHGSDSLTVDHIASDTHWPSISRSASGWFVMKIIGCPERSISRYCSIPDGRKRFVSPWRDFGWRRIRGRHRSLRKCPGRSICWGIDPRARSANYPDCIGSRSI